MFETLAQHWPEYLMEAALLGCFMISACVCAGLLEHPAGLGRRFVHSALARRSMMGLAMGLTAVVLIYSPWGQQSGAHMNPATTLTFFLCGKVAPWDALFYVLAQFAGAAAGVGVARLALREWIRHASVNHVVTMPGRHGVAVAWLAELFIAFGMMLTVFFVSNDTWLTPYTGFFAGALVALYITIEAPLSGTSMNPARTFGSAVAARQWKAFWVYLSAPAVGMPLASAAFAALPVHNRVYCAKLDHCNQRRCIFRCEFDQLRKDYAPPVSEIGGQPRRAAVEAVTTVGLTVSDLDRAVSFFTDVLMFEKVEEVKLAGGAFGRLQGLSDPTARVARLRLGDEFIELTEYESPKGRPFPPDSRSNDRWFQHIAIIVSDMEKAHAWLHEKMVRHASKDPQRLPDWNQNAAGIKAFYFRDPDGHFLEVLEFPADKGNPKWHRQTDKLFLGIDHTAIVVADTEASLRFYRDVLGFKVVGGSENYGMEQEDLNNVPGAHLRITTLRSPAGPAIEFLEYLHPRDGRPCPSDVRTNDLLHWQTTLVMRNTTGLAEKLRKEGGRFISDGLVNSTDSHQARQTVFLLRDPDGHAMKIIGE